MKQYYEILWLQESATLEEVKQAFKKLSLLTHPDKGWSEYLFKILNWAYQEIINSFKEWNSKTTEINFILLPSVENKNLNSNKIVEQICSEIFNVFKSLNYNPFTVWIKLKYLIIIVKKYNSLKLVLSNELHSIALSNLFKFNTAYDICKHLSELHWVDTKQDWFDAWIKQLLIKLAAKDIIDTNWWMAFNDWWVNNNLNQTETVDIKDHNKVSNKNHSNNNPSNNRLRDMMTKNNYQKIDKNDISHNTTKDNFINILIITFLLVWLAKVLYSLI